MLKDYKCVAIYCFTVLYDQSVYGTGKNPYMNVEQKKFALKFKEFLLFHIRIVKKINDKK